MKTLKIYQYSIIVALIALAGLDIFFIVRTFMMLPDANPLQDFILLLVCLFFLLAMLVTGVVNTFISQKKGSAFLRALALNEDLTLNTKLIVFCYIVGALAIGAIIYFILILLGFPIYFATFPVPLCYLIIGFMGLILVASVAIILFPYLGKADISYTRKR